MKFSQTQCIKQHFPKLDTPNASFDQTFNYFASCQTPRWQNKHRKSEHRTRTIQRQNKHWKSEHELKQPKKQQTLCILRQTQNRNAIKTPDKTKWQQKRKKKKKKQNKGRLRWYGLYGKERNAFGFDEVGTNGKWRDLLKKKERDPWLCEEKEKEKGKLYSYPPSFDVITIHLITLAIVINYGA